MTSELPFSVSVPADAAAANARECVRVSWTSGRSCEISWPLGFTFTEAVSGSSRTYSVGVVPYDPGGTFDWGGAAAAQDGGGSVRARASAMSAAASCGCASGEGRTLSFSCSAGCPCVGVCICHGADANDVEVVGEFIENETGRTFTSRAALTVVRVEVRATVDPPDTSAGRLNRHRYGVCEEVRLLQFPSSPAVSWTDSTPGGVSCAGSSLYECPLQGCENPLRAACGGASYAPRLTVVEPESVYAELRYGISAGSVLRYGAAKGQAGGVGMLLKMYVRPLDVSFVRIEVQEVPSLTYVPHGYFRNPYFSGLFGHTTVAGAGRWLDVDPRTHLWGRDEAAYHDTIPWLTADGRPTDSVECSWTDGYVYIDHPFGWRPRELERVGNDPDWHRPFAADAQVELMLDGHGTVGVRKLYHQVRRATNDVVWLDWKKVVE